LKKRRKEVYCVIFLSVLFFINFEAIVEAFSVFPPRAEFVVEPNKKIIVEYTITNPDNKPLCLKIFVEGGGSEQNAAGWITVRPKEFTIPANGSRKIKCEVIAPARVRGEYLASLVFRPVSPSAKSGMIDIYSQITLQAYVVIKGTEEVRGEISRFEVLRAVPLKISVKVKNFGNIHVRPRGTVEMIKLDETGSEETKIATLLLNPIDGPIFPNGHEGEIGPKSEDVRLEPGTYTAKARVEFTPEVILKKEIEFNVTGEEAK
jgi:hypothetical protein